MAGWHPLRGQDPGALNERFVALSDVYDLSLRASAFEAWAKIGGDGKYRLLEGIYAYVCGPRSVRIRDPSQPPELRLMSISYETRAECRMLSLLGADLVGMSTVPEVIVARQCALKILALSLVTNKTVSEPGPNAAGRTGSVTVALQSMMTTGKANHLEVLSVGSKAANSIKVGPIHP